MREELSLFPPSLKLECFIYFCDSVVDRPGQITGPSPAQALKIKPRMSEKINSFYFLLTAHDSIFAAGNQ